MDTDLNIIQYHGKTLVSNEFIISNEDMKEFKFDDLINVKPIGMSLEKVQKAKIELDNAIKGTDNLIKLVAFINVNGCSNLIQTNEYAKEANLIRTLSQKKIKQSLFRVYYGVFKQINEMQLKKLNMNYYSRKALKLGIDGDYSKMHFAFEFDKELCENKLYLDLKNKIVNK